MSFTVPPVLNSTGPALQAFERNIGGRLAVDCRRCISGTSTPTSAYAATSQVYPAGPTEAHLTTPSCVLNPAVLSQA